MPKQNHLVSAQRVYVALGDSITGGYGVAFGFVDLLAERLRAARPETRWRIVNSGASGETSSEALFRLETDVLSHRPSLVTVNYGVNDAFSGISPDRFEANLSALVGAISKTGCLRIVLLSSEVIPDDAAERQVLPYWEAMRRAAEGSGAVYADVNGSWRRKVREGVREERLIIPGDLHPNEEGHRLIADAVWKSIEENRVLDGL